MKRAALCSFLVVAIARIAHADDFFLKDKDTVVFYGDSITAQRLYTTFVESVAVTRRLDLDLHFVHSGWGGDTVRGGGGGPIDRRLERDVIAWKPTVVTIMLGMNDGSYRPFDEKIFAAYKKGYEHVVATLKAKLPDARLVLVEPSPFDDVTRKPTFEGGYNAVLVKYGEFVRELAKKEGCASVDLNGPVVACLEKASAEKGDLAQKIVPDRVHPAPAGHLVMAAALLRAWGLPSLVSDVTVDLSAKKVVKAENADVAEIDSLSWTQTDKVLPLPIDFHDPAVALAVRSSDLIAALEHHVVRVTGGDAERYELRVDERRIGEFSKADLEKGVSLSVHPTPMRQQANEVFAITRRRTEAADTRWQRLVVPFDGKKSDNLAKALEGLSGLVEELRDEQRAAARPKPHRYHLVPLR